MPPDPLSLANPASPILAADPATSAAKEQFLRFRLGANTTALLPIPQLTEALTIPMGQILPIPHLPAWAMGVYNWRGEILWMVDLACLVGLMPWYKQAMSRPTYSALVLHPSYDQSSRSANSSQILGLVVDRVEDIEWFPPEAIQSPPTDAVVADLVPFLRGYWLNSDGELAAVLDGESIISRISRMTDRLAA